MTAPYLRHIAYKIKRKNSLYVIKRYHLYVIISIIYASYKLGVITLSIYRTLRKHRAIDCFPL